MSEAQLQAQCYQHFHNTYPQLRRRLFHVPNGELRNKYTAAKLKAMGVVAGVPDFLFITPNNGLVAIELKVGKGKLSDNQKKWIESTKTLTFVVYSFDEFKNIIEKYV